jgi:hypothetical protein
VVKTTDFGATWTSVTGDLPRRAVDVIVEDPGDQDTLLAGTSGGVFLSIDGGQRWVALKGNMPTVPVTDLAIHPREHDLVVGTYGRGLYVANLEWLAEARRGALDEALHFFAVRPRPLPRDGPWGNFEFYGDRHLIVPNDENLLFEFFLKERAPGKAKVTIADPSGATIRTVETEARAGFNRVEWDMRVGRGAFAAPGDYTVTLQVGDRTLAQKARILDSRSTGL